MGKIAVVVVAKAPVVGKVKTRLCPPLDYEQAAKLYSGFLLDAIEIALQVPDSTVMAVCPSQDDANMLSQLLPSQVGYIVQSDAGLTDALLTSFTQCLEKGYQKVLCTSSDNPTLPIAYLHQAIDKLDEVELVLGPSEDGGYYLIGAKLAYPTLFENMIWSTDTVLKETLERANASKLSTILLPFWYDLDTYQELARFMTELAHGENNAKHTRAALNSLDIGAKIGKV